MALATAQTVSAGSAALTGTADGDSRWFEAHSDAFGQLDQAYPGFPASESFYRISDESGVTVADLSTFDATTFSPTLFNIDLAPGVEGQQGGPADIFPNGAAFDLGTLDFTGTVGGSGVEVFTVTGVSGLDFAANIADDDGNTFTLPTGYTTALNNVVGTATFTDGLLTSIDVTSDITFAYGALEFDGSLNFSGNEFDLFVDDIVQGFTPFPDTAPQFSFDVRYIWDSEGTVNQVVPEPTSFALFALGGLALTRRRR